MLNRLRSGALYDAVAKADVERVYEHWHASAIAQCPRAHYMKRLGIPRLQVPSPAKILRWQSGHSIEEALRPHIEGVYGEVTSNERFTSETLDFTGEYDNRSGSKLIEVKSVHDLAFHEDGGLVGLKEDTGQRGPRGGKVYRVKDTPYTHHEWQNHGYVLLLKEAGITIESIDYVYTSLSGRIVVYSTQVSSTILAAVLERLKALQTAWESKTPPACVCKDYSSPFYESVYKWCDYRDETNNTCCEIK